MKNYLIALLFFSAVVSFAQNNTGAGGNNIDGSYEMYRTMSPLSTAGNRKVWFKLRDSIYVYFWQDSAAFKTPSGSGNRFVVAKPSGRLTTGSMGDFVTASAFSDSLAWLWSALANTLKVTDTVPSGGIMTIYAANQAITLLDQKIDTRIPFTDTSGRVATRYWVSGRGFLTTESDPQFDTKFAAKSTTGLPEGTNLYFTNARARSAISLTTAGSGAASYNNSTGVLNVPTFSGNPLKVYDGSGQLDQTIKIWADTLTPNTGNGYTVDISAAGFTAILSVSAGTEFGTSTTTSMRNVEIKSVSTTAVVVNIAVPNANNIALLGLTLLGVPSFLGAGTGTKLHITVIGY